MKAVNEGVRPTGRVSSSPIERRAGCSISIAAQCSMLNTEAQLAGNKENPNPSHTSTSPAGPALPAIVSTPPFVWPTT